MTGGEEFTFRGFLVYMFGCSLFATAVGLVLFHEFGFSYNKALGSIAVITCLFGLSGLFTAAQKGVI